MSVHARSIRLGQVRAMAERLATPAAGAARRTGMSASIGFDWYPPSVMDTCLGREMLAFASSDHRIAGGAFVNT